MDSNLLLRNRAVSRIVLGTPEGQQHIRARIETGSGDVITLQEATIAAICRAFIDIKTHPHRQAVELRSAEVRDGKPGYALFQLLEVEADEARLCSELSAPPTAATAGDEPDDLVLEASEPTLPHRRDDLPEIGEPATQRLPEMDIDSGELAPVGEDDGPVFGDIPTVHTKQQLPDSD